MRNFLWSENNYFFPTLLKIDPHFRLNPTNNNKTGHSPNDVKNALRIALARTGAEINGFLCFDQMM